MRTDRKNMEKPKTTVYELIQRCLLKFVIRSIFILKLYEMAFPSSGHPVFVYEKSITVSE